MSEEQTGIEIELFDLGNATIETKQWSIYPIWFDSYYGRGLPD